MLSVSMPNSSTSFLLVETATKCLATASSPSASVSQRRAAVALVSVSSVENVFEATMKSVVAGSKSARVGDQVGGVDVGDEPRRDAGVGVVAQRLVDHHRPEVRAADADVDDGA